MTSVREVRTSDSRIDTGFGAAGQMRLGVDEAGRYRLKWAGSLCDGDMTVTIAESVRRIDIFGGKRTGCDAVGVGRELVLTFSKPVDPAAAPVFYDVTILREE